MSTSLPRRSVRSFACLSFSVLLGGVIGLCVGVASQSFSLLGLWPLASGVGGAFAMATICHRFQLTARTLHIALALCFVLSWAGAERVGSGWALWEQLRGDVSRSGLVLADHAIVHDESDPGALVDASLLADTGAAGVLGALRLGMRGGLPMLRAPGVHRVLPAPRPVVIAWLALRAGLVTWLVLSAFAALRRMPQCVECGDWLDAESMGWTDRKRAAPFEELTLDALLGELPRHPLASSASEETPLEWVRLACPRGHAAGLTCELRGNQPADHPRQRPKTLRTWRQAARSNSAKS